MNHAKAINGQSKVVFLHKDERMKTVQSQMQHQPLQLDLYQMLVGRNYSNSVELYQTLPDVYCGKQDKLRNKDGTLPVLSRHGKYRGTSYTLDISPANITISPQAGQGKRKKAFYKTVVAEFVEYALHKLAIADGFFLNDREVKTESFGLITTYYRIREELIVMGKHYSYEQIRDGIAILAGLRYELSGDISKDYGIDSFFSPIDLIVKNDKKNPYHSELYITFNRMISNRILALDWRQFNYAEFMKVKTSFGRSLFLRLSHRFVQADPVTGYQFLLSTLIEEGALLQDLVTTNIKKINVALQECTYLIDRYQSEERSSINPATGRQLVVDYKVTVYPTQVFQREQYRFNVHHKSIREHRVTAQGKAVIKPLRDQYPSRYDFEQYMEDKALFDTAKVKVNNGSFLCDGNVG